MTAALRAIPPAPLAVRLEECIAAELENAFAAERRGDKIAAHAHLVRMAELHTQRDPQTVAQMERERGLR